MIPLFFAEAVFVPTKGNLFPGHAESLSSPPISSGTIAIIAVIVILWIFLMVFILKKYKSVNKNIDSGFLKIDLSEKLANRLARDGPLQYDFFSFNELYSMSYNLKGFGKMEFSYFSDLFNSPKHKSPSAISEYRAVISMGGFGANALKKLKGTAVTKTKKDTIIMHFKEGLFEVLINDKIIGSIDLINKQIVFPDSTKLASLDFPGLYLMGVNTVKWKINFSEDKWANVIASQNFFKIRFQLIPDVKIKVVETSGNLSKNEKAFVLALYLFIKIKNSFSH